MTGGCRRTGCQLTERNVPERGARGTYSVASIENDIHAPLTQATSNVTLDMSGVTLIMEHRNHTAVKISSWTNVTMQGLSVKYRTLPTNQA